MALSQLSLFMYKIATWNVERPKKGTEKTALVMEKIKEINADILVLTESAVSIFG